MPSRVTGFGVDRGAAQKGLEEVISYTVVDWFLGPGGWRFSDSVPKCEPDPVNGKAWLREIYLMCDPDYKGNITVPVLFDKKTNRIVNNESSEIIRMLNSEFNAWSKRPELDLYPEALRAEIDEVNAFVYPNVNNGASPGSSATNVPSARLSRRPRPIACLAQACTAAASPRRRRRTRRRSTSCSPRWTAWRSAWAARACCSATGSPRRTCAYSPRSSGSTPCTSR